ALDDEVRESVEQLDEPVAVVLLDGAVGEHERRRRLLAAAHRLDVAAQGPPAREALARREIPARLGRAHPADTPHAVRATLVVIEVGVERLLEREPLDVRLELRPAREAELAGELELHVGKLDVVAARAPLTRAVLGLLAQLLEVELRGHNWLPSVV